MVEEDWVGPFVNGEIGWLERGVVELCQPVH